MPLGRAALDVVYNKMKKFKYASSNAGRMGLRTIKKMVTRPFMHDDITKLKDKWQ